MERKKRLRSFVGQAIVKVVIHTNVVYAEQPVFINIDKTQTAEKVKLTKDTVKNV